MNTHKATLCLEDLESRSLLSGTSWGTFLSPSPAVQADLAKIQTDSQTLHTDLVNLAPTLQKDQQALKTAITAAIQNDVSVQTAEATLKTDTTTWGAKLKADWQAIWSETSVTTWAAALTQLKTDGSAAAAAIKSDIANVHTAIEGDAGVKAAQTQLQTDFAPIVADRATLHADYVQLQKDLQAQASANVMNH